MKKTILTLCIGMFIGLLAGSVSGSFAAIGDRVEAIVAEYNIVVDGEVQVLEASPVAINDSTYVPLRAMANMLGKDVTYKADSRTIELNTPSDQFTEVETVETTSLTIEEQIAFIDFQILEIEKYLNTIISRLQYNETSGDRTQEVLDQSRSNIVKTEAVIADLEAQKAALQAQ